MLNTFIVAFVAIIGCGITLFSAIRIWQTMRSRGPRELVLGYIALMLIVSGISLLVLRALT